jgi:hypothetical protein
MGTYSLATFFFSSVKCLKADAKQNRVLFLLLLLLLLSSSLLRMKIFVSGYILKLKVFDIEYYFSNDSNYRILL